MFVDRREIQENQIRRTMGKLQQELMASGAEVSEENWLDRPVLRKRARSQNPSVRPWGKEDRTVFENCTCGQSKLLVSSGGLAIV